MKLDLKEWLNKITSRKPVFEYVGNYGSNVFNNSWVATDDGVAVVIAVWNTSGAFAYWYIKDSTDNRDIVNLGGNANGTALSTMIPIIKGHVYTSSTASAVNTAHFYFYKIKYMCGGGYCLTVFSRLSAIFRRLGVA